jgi:hypothetical protein
MNAKLLLLCAVFTVAYTQQTLSYYQSAVKQGYTSWYDSWSPGSGCGYNENIFAGYQPSVVLTAAINQGQYYNGEICGMCIQVNNVTAIGDYNTLKPFPSTPFIAFINNLCTTCTTNQLDFYRTPQVQNNWYLDWIAVDCPVGTTKIQYQIEKGGHNYYFKFLPLYNLRILSNAWVNQNGGFTACERQNGYFACQAQGGPFGADPQIKLKSVDGEEVVDNIKITLTGTPTGSIQVVSGTQNVNFSAKNVAAPGAIKASEAIRAVTSGVGTLIFLLFALLY